MFRVTYAVKGESWNLKNSLRSKGARKAAMFSFRSRAHRNRWCVTPPLLRRHQTVTLTTFRSVGNYKAEQFADCRVDHYQTPNEVHVSVFAKQADKEKSKVTVEETQVGTATQTAIKSYFTYEGICRSILIYTFLRRNGSSEQSNSLVQSNRKGLRTSSLGPR